MEKKATVTHDPLPVIDAIPLQINQLFFNLLGNALKFTKTDVAPVISIRLKMLTQEDIIKRGSLNDKLTYCEIIFQDNGIGFNQKFSEQIFLIFHRLHAREDLHLCSV